MTEKRNLVLDAEKMRMRGEAHTYLKEMFEFPEYYGANLDALHDCLTELGPTEVVFINEEKGGDFFKKVLRVFHDSADENPNLVIVETEE